MQRVQKDIYELLQASKQGLTISQVADIMNIERHTAAKFLEGLAGLGVCEYTTIGKSKVWKAIDSPLFTMMNKDTPVSSELKWLLQEMDEHVTIQDGNNTILWSNKPESTGKKCYEVFANKNCVCENCEVNDNDQFKVKCQDLHLTSSSVKNSQGEIVGRINIRKTAK